MSVLTIDIPDDLARYVARENALNPSWIETALRKAVPSLETGENASSIHLATEEEKAANRRLCGCCVGLVGPGDVDRFLAECRADKERELAIDKRQKAESAYMPPDECLLDACALLTLYNKEQGWEKVQNIINHAERGDIKLHINIVNLVEVYYDRIRVVGRAKADDLIADIYASSITVIDKIPPEVAREAARLKSEAGMSLGDTFLVATAICTGATVVTCDHAELDIIDKQGIVPFHWIRPRSEKC